jgi:hypothetical protein
VCEEEEEVYYVCLNRVTANENKNVSSAAILT